MVHALTRLFVTLVLLLLVSSSSSAGLAQKKAAERDLTKGVPIVDVNNLLKEMGFEVAKAGTVFTVGIGGKTIQLFTPECKNPKTKVTIHYKLENPGAKYSLSVSHEKARKDALVALAAKISPKLEQAAKEALDEFKRSEKQSIKKVGKLTVRVNKEEIALEGE